MELKWRYYWRRFVSLFYVMAFSVYLILGLQPVEAKNYEISGALAIPSIGLVSDVTTLELNNHVLDTPDTIVGSYSRYSSKIFLIGHSTTVFKNLNNAEIGDVIFYNDTEYKIVSTETLKKDDVNMDAIIAPTKTETVIIMTCAGESLGNKDATHRLIVTAEKM